MHGGVVLWSPHELGKAPVLVIGEFQAGTIPAAACGLVDGRVDITGSTRRTPSLHAARARILVRDPAATATDWRVAEGNQPAASAGLEARSGRPSSGGRGEFFGLRIGAGVSH
jgi:hypothetical protein